MAIGVIVDFEGATLDQYDAVIAKMGFEKGGNGAPGGRHWVTATDVGIRVTDVWEDRQTFEKFADEKIGPITAEVGILGPPKIAFFPVRNYLTAR